MEPPPFGDGNIGRCCPGESRIHPSMEPPPFGDGNRNIGIEGFFTSTAFNGATALRRWKRQGKAQCPPCLEILQWSHRPSAMETRSTDAANSSQQYPSMEPPPFGDGNNDYAPVDDEYIYPSMEPPPFGDGNLDTTSRIREVIYPSMEPPPFGDGNPPVCGRVGHGMAAFNGATALRRWKHVAAGMALRPRGPSMEPPPFGDGNAAARRPARRAPPAFNGATALRRWKRGATPMARPATTTTFNGATALRRWKLSSTSDTSSLTPTFNGATALRRWKPGSVLRRRLEPSAFNGATALRRWKHGPAVLPGCHLGRPSMEPPPFGDGNNCTLIIMSAQDRLQWSHRPSAMETGQRRHRSGCLHPPSMEPPPFGDGNQPLPQPRYLYRLQPSMEPPPFGDGNMGRTSAAAKAREYLQWSHRPSAMETNLTRL